MLKVQELKSQEECQLMEFIEKFALQENCKVVALSSGLERNNVHRFYQERMNYEKPSYVFKKVVDSRQ